jgi:hypothetical protein
MDETDDEQAACPIGDPTLQKTKRYGRRGDEQQYG